MTVYRTDGAWGAGKGSNLAPAEVDGNFYDIETRVSFIEDNPVEPITPIAINIEGGQFTMGLSDGSTLGPITITYPMPLWRGTWAPSIEYNEMDFFTAPDGGLGAVMIGHTSAATFDWGALSGGAPVYQQLVGGSGTTNGISDLTDVALGSQADDDMLVWDGAASLWRNETAAVVVGILPAFGGATGSLPGAKGVVPAPAAGDNTAGKFLSAGGTWAVPAAGGGGSTSLAGLSDVSISSPANLSLLQYHATDGKWHNATLAALGSGTVTSVDSGAGLTGGPITSAGSLSLAPIAALNLLANASGVSAAPAATSISALLDAAIGSARGSLIRRGTSDWTVLAPGTAGQYLQSGGSGADLTWGNPAGAGTVTSIATSGGIAGGPITGSGTLSLAAVATGSLLANVSGGSASPTATSLSALLDNALGSGRGQVIYRGASGWAALSPGTNGYFLQTNGSGADPAWATVKGGGGAATAPTLWHAACDYATTAALPAATYANGSAGVGATLTATGNGALSVDGSTVAAGNRILVKDQAALLQNGCYVVTATGSGAAAFVLTRAADYDQPAEVAQGSAFPITSGTANDGTAWVLITGGTITIGTTPLEFQGLSATMPVCQPGEVLGNPLSIPAPAVPMTPSGGAGSTKYVVGCYVPGLLTASQSLLYHRFTKAITIPANLGAYSGHTTVAGGGVAATGSTAIVLQKATAAAPTSFSTVATITVAAASATGTMSTQAAISFAQGDVLRVQAPGTADATFADFHMSLVGNE